MDKDISAAIECQIYAEQENYIREHFGDEAAQIANYGWGVDTVGERIDISTKVYGHGVLETEATSLEDITHHMRHDNGQDDD